MKEACGNCLFAEQEEGGFLYCVIKDLYTEVGEDDECDEIDLYGNKMYVQKQDV